MLGSYSMFEEWRFEAKLKKLQKESAANYDYYLPKINEARKKKDENTVGELQTLGSMEQAEIQWSIEKLITSHLTEQAQRLIVPIPSTKDATMWDIVPEIGRKVLTPVGIKTLRNEIHDEIKKRWERRYIWLQPVANIISLLVALGGLTVAILSLWLKKP